MVLDCLDGQFKYMGLLPESVPLFHVSSNVIHRENFGQVTKVELLVRTFVKSISRRDEGFSYIKLRYSL